MRGIPEATPITLTNEERAELEGLARSTKTEHRMRQRARIVLLAADKVATRAIGRAASVYGTASKWRVRYAEKRRASLFKLTGGCRPGKKRSQASVSVEHQGIVLVVRSGQISCLYRQFQNGWGLDLNIDGSNTRLCGRGDPSSHAGQDQSGGGHGEPHEFAGLSVLRRH